jgi:hypothetical protein
MRRLLVSIPLLVSACGAKGAPRLPLERVASPPPAPPSDRVVYLDDRTPSYDDFLVSPDDRRALRAVVVFPGRTPAIAVGDLSPEAKGGVVRLLIAGDEAQPQSFLDARRILARVVPDRAAVVDVDTGDARFFPSASVPADSPALIAAVEPGGAIVIRDAATLAVRARSDVKLAGKLEDAMLSFPAPNRVLCTLSERGVLLDAATGAVLHDGPELELSWDRPRTSPSGRYFATARPVGGGSAAVQIVIIDTERKIEPIGVASSALRLPAFAFSRDERTVVSTGLPGVLYVTDLATRRTRESRVGLERDGRDGPVRVTDRIGLGDDGLVCGHVSTSIGKYTSCSNEISVDLQGVKSRIPKVRGAARTGARGGGFGGSPPIENDSVAYCFIDGESAHRVTLPKTLAAPGRELLPTLSATYTRLCNEALSPDGATFAIADRRLSKRSDRFEDVQLLLVDARTGTVQHSVPLGDANGVTNGVLEARFSPDGRWIQAELDEGRFITVDVARGVALSPAPPGGRFGPASSIILGDFQPVRIHSLVSHETFPLCNSWPEGKLDDVPGAARAALAALHGAFTTEDDRRVRVYRSTASPDRAAVLVALGKDAAVGFLPDGRFELMGNDADLRRAAEGLVCVSGSAVAPLAACAERHRAVGEWEKLFAQSDPRDGR